MANCPCVLRGENLRFKLLHLYRNNCKIYSKYKINRIVHVSMKYYLYVQIGSCIVHTSVGVHCIWSHTKHVKYSELLMMYSRKRIIVVELSFMLCVCVIEMLGFQMEQPLPSTWAAKAEERWNIPNRSVQGAGQQDKAGIREQSAEWVNRAVISVKFVFKRRCVHVCVPHNVTYLSV